MKIAALGRGQVRPGIAGRQPDQVKGFGKMLGQLDQGGGLGSIKDAVTARDAHQETDSGEDHDSGGSGHDQNHSNDQTGGREAGMDLMAFDEINSASAVLARSQGGAVDVPRIATETGGAPVAAYTMCPHVSLLGAGGGAALNTQLAGQQTDLPEGLAWASPEHNRPEPTSESDGD